MFGEIDIEDAIAGTVFMLSAAVSAGIAGNQTYYGYDISGALTTIEGTAITAAFLLTVGSLAAAYITNRTDASAADMDIDTDLADLVTMQASAESYALIGTIVVVLMMGLDILGFRGFVQSSYIYGTIVVVLESAGYYVVSYMG